jgi:hypothetical protein
MRRRAGVSVRLTTMLVPVAEADATPRVERECAEAPEGIGGYGAGTGCSAQRRRGPSHPRDDQRNRRGQSRPMEWWARGSGWAS